MTLHVPRLPFTIDPLIAEAKKRARQRRFLTLIVLLIALATGLTLALRSGGGGPSGVIGTAGAPAHVGALAAAVPPGLRQRQIRIHGKLIGTLITDYRVTPNSPTLKESVFPASGVLLSLGRGPSALPLRSLPPLRLPLTLSELKGPEHNTNGTNWNNLFAYRGQMYAINFWAGRTAPSADLAALKHALLSIHSSG